MNEQIIFFPVSDNWGYFFFSEKWWIRRSCWWIIFFSRLIFVIVSEYFISVSVVGADLHFQTFMNYYLSRMKNEVFLSSKFFIQCYVWFCIQFLSISIIIISFSKTQLTELLLKGNVKMGIMVSALSTL